MLGKRSLRRFFHCDPNWQYLENHQQDVRSHRRRYSTRGAEGLSPAKGFAKQAENANVRFVATRPTVALPFRRRCRRSGHGLVASSRTLASAKSTVTHAASK